MIVQPRREERKLRSSDTAIHQAYERFGHDRQGALPVLISLETHIGGDNRPIFLNTPIVNQL